MSKYRLLINGKLIHGASSIKIYNPATEQVVGEAPLASEAQLNEAVAAASAALPEWAATPIDARADALVEMANIIDAHAKELTELLSEETGHPIANAGYEIAGLSEVFKYFSALRFPDRTVEDSHARKARLIRRPLGVVAAILPWNFPYTQLGAKVAPALLAGNTVVIKPAGTTPLATLRLGELVAPLLPPGALNIISDNNDLGDRLTAHPQVRMVSFTGSTAIGKRIMASAANSLKRIALELGGNDAAIVLDDANPQQIAQGLFMGAFYHSGQSCCGIKRLYVHESLYEDVVAELACLARAATETSSADGEVPFAPLQNRKQFERALSFLEDAKADGVIVAGGEPLKRPGYFIPPTIVRDVAEHSRLVNEEQFSPILPVLRFQDENDAVARANASPYGLGASVWSSDIERAMSVAARLDVGTAWINKHADTATNVPFCGAKLSGIGVESGEEGLLEFTQIQVINGPSR